MSLKKTQTRMLAWRLTKIWLGLGTCCGQVVSVRRMAIVKLLTCGNYSVERHRSRTQTGKKVNQTVAATRNSACICGPTMAANGTTHRATSRFAQCANTLLNSFKQT